MNICHCHHPGWRHHAPSRTNPALCSPVCHRTKMNRLWSKITHYPYTEHRPAYTFTHTQVWSGSCWGPRAPSFQHKPLLTSDVIHHHSHRGIPDVAGDQAAEPLLPRSVPELQSNLQGPNRGISRGGWRPRPHDAGTLPPGLGRDFQECPSRGF